MIKRFCIQYAARDEIRMFVLPGEGAPLFNSEEQAEKYMKKSNNFSFSSIVPIFVSEKIAELQTISI